MTPIAERVGAEMRRGRQAAGLTQAQAAALVGLTRTSIANIEGGRQDTTVSTYFSLLDLYGLKPVTSEANSRLRERLRHALDCLTDEFNAGLGGPSALRAEAIASVRTSLLMLEVDAE